MHRSRSREKPHRSSDLRPVVRCEPLSHEPADAEGFIQLRNHIKASSIDLDSKFSFVPPTEENSITFDFKISSSKKEAREPRSAPLAEVMPIEKKNRLSSPSVIARLMGLDTLPSPGSLKPGQKVEKSYSHKVSSKEFQEKLTRHEDCLLQKHNDEYQEFKDVFEVMEVPKLDKHKNKDIHKQMPNFKQSDMDMAFIRQSFINAKRLSTDEKLQRSKEFDDALEVLESNKDLFLKLLQEPHSLFSKHLQDPRHFTPSPHASHALIQKSSIKSLTTSCESSLRSEIKDKRYTNLQRSDSQSLKKPAANSNGHPFREPLCFRPEKFSGSMHVGKVEDHSQPTQIVILKPSLEKAWKLEKTVRTVKSLDNSQYCAINHREIPKEEIMELYQEERGRQKLDNLENMRLRTKHTTGLSKDFPQHMRNTSATGKKVSVSKYSKYVEDDGLWPMPSIENGNNSLNSYWTSDNFYENGKTFSPSSSCAIASSANKRLFEKWRLTHHEIGLPMRESSTLGEMLALSDKEKLKTARDTSVVKVARSVGISSKDGWKDGFSRNLSRSKSLPASSLVDENCQHNSRNSVVSSKRRFMPKNIHNMSSGTFVNEDPLMTKNSSLKSLPDHQNRSKIHSDKKRNILPVPEICVSSEEFKHKSYLGPLAEKEYRAYNLSDIRSTDVDIFSVPSCNIAELSFSRKDKGLEKLRKVKRSEKNGKHLECGRSKMHSKEASANHGGDELLPSVCTKSAAVSPDSYKEADQPSPVSVLELSSKDDKSTSGCFKKIGDDLQELRMQLQLLKFDSSDSFVEEIVAFISSDEDAADPFPPLGDILQAFRDEDDRDYSYLLDMLIDSGILKSERSGLWGACHLTELPVGLDVLDKLEKKYKSAESWSRSERKLLFDLVNTTLGDIAATPFMKMKPSLCWQSKMEHEGLVEEVWQAVVKRRKEVKDCSVENHIGVEWFGARNDSEVICRELENMLSEHLMNELVKELICK